MAQESRAPPERSSSLDSFLGASEVILTILKQASTVSPVPFLGDAAKLSLGILNAVQAVRKNKVLWISLAQDIARLVVVVVRKFDNSNLNSDTLDQIEQLHSMVRNIEGTVKGMVSRSLVKRAIAFGSDAQKVQKYRQELDLAIDLFGVRAAITNAENMQEILVSQQRLISGQGSIRSKQDELLSNQRMTNELLRKIDTNIGVQRQTGPFPPSAVPIFPEHTPSLSPTQSATPSSLLQGFPHALPENANITIIVGNKTVNNINSVTNNSHSNIAKTINTINSHNTYTTVRSGVFFQEKEVPRLLKKELLDTKAERSSHTPASIGASESLRLVRVRGCASPQAIDNSLKIQIP
ncbi:hypothetical protein EYR38_001572 [Pleurotus pulmonarius]|nr:hypothetical protein EYR38_001572 [Pleurotus pulmonarius]